MKPFISVSVYLIVFLLGFLTFYLLQSTKPPLNLNSHYNFVPIDTDIYTKASISPPKTNKESIDFVGDVMLARNVELYMQEYGYGYPFGRLEPHASTSYLVGNFEASIPKKHEQTQSMQFAFSVKPEYLQGLQEYGFTHLGIANNHSYDFGSDGFRNTMTTLTSYNFHPFGDQNNQASSTIQYLQVDNTTVALVGVFAVGIDPSPMEMIKLLTQAKTHSDIQIVFVHFGTEYQEIHNQSQEKLAHLLVDAGADIIIGHHPHVVQDIELYENAPIFYSLGNYIFDQYFSTQVQQGLTLRLFFRQNGFQIELLPVTSVGSRSAPRSMDNTEKKLFLDQLAQNSQVSLAKMIQAGSIFIAYTVH